MQDYFFFFLLEKQLLKYLNVNYLLRKGLLCKLSNKNKERKERRGSKKRRKTHPFLQKPESMHSSFLLISCSIDMQC